ncbi:methyltransferase [Tepidiforma flava]|uniref:Methyltransferase n=1 Tax=Tepidiforma flava TaxID=3004094 RepID=A0ABY7MB47_9CHLR|nr:methyltransferase [Tepidiforma flava]WBL37249.1 methyltransferase [Tepidiforma flava]
MGRAAAGGGDRPAGGPAGRRRGFAPPPGAADALRRAAGEVPGPGCIVGSPAARAWLERARRAPSPGVPLAAGGGLSCLGEAEAAAEVAAAHAALPPGGRLLLLEPVLPADPRAAPGLALRDLELLALGRGRLRGLEEWRKLFERAGLRFDGAAPVKGTAGWMVLTASRGLV